MRALKTITQVFDRCAAARVRASLVLCIAALIFSPLSTHAETATLQYDNNGNITQRTTPLGTTTYTYDPLNRLKSEAGPAKTQNFTYDENGNRLSDGAGSYTYETGSNRMLTRRGLAVTVDATGIITADGTGREYVINQAGQIAQVKQNGILIATYEYDTNGLRMSKTTTANAPQGAQTIVYHYDLDGRLIAETTATGSPLRSYIWRDDTPVAQIEYVPSRKIYNFNVDQLNTPRAMMDDTGKVVWRWESDAFGSTLPNEDPDGDGVKMTSNLRFTGQYYDQETGLHYNWHRYYDPSMGQYPQADTVGLAAGTNLYQYVNSNPLIYIDPLGLSGGPAAKGTTYPKGNIPKPATPSKNDPGSADGAVDGTNGLLCGLGLKSACIPDEATRCAEWQCTPKCGKPYRLYRYIPSLNDPDTPCVCVRKEINPNYDGRVPGL